jgi:hypothetical protein
MFRARRTGAWHPDHPGPPRTTAMRKGERTVRPARAPSPVHVWTDDQPYPHDVAGADAVRQPCRGNAKETRRVISSV